MDAAVFIDRDGVINRACVLNGKPFPPAHIDDLVILPGVAQAIAHLKQAGYRTLVATNQPDVATGKQRREAVEAMHERLQADLRLDDIFVCYHVDQHQCDCRKPRPGMLLEGARRWNIDLKKSFMVGDRWRDVDAGRQAGCRTFWVKGPESYEEQAPRDPDWTVESLLEASRIILALGRPTEEKP